MKIFRVLPFIVLCVFCSAQWSASAEFQPIGTDAMSMGGAGVAAASGSYATYYNPALLAVPTHGMVICVSPGIGFRESNLVDSVDTLADIQIEDTLGELESPDDFDYTNLNVNFLPGDRVNIQGDLPGSIQSDFQTITKHLRILSDSNGLQLMPSMSLGIQAGQWGFGAYGLSEATATSVIARDKLDIIVKTEENGQTFYVEYDPATNEFSQQDRAAYEARSLEYAIENNETYLKITGLSYVEIPIGYGHQFQTEYGDISVGSAVKIMPGWTYSAIIDIDTESDDIVEEFEESEETDTAWGLDLGFLYSHPAVPGFSTGLVFKNINTPEFDTSGTETLEVDPQARIGFAYRMWENRITLALDADLTTNETYIPGYDTRFIGGGVNFHPYSWLSLRGGLMQNVAETDEGIILTGGLGFGLKWLQLDLGGQYSTKSGEFDGNEIPRYGRVQLALVSKWG